MGPAQKHLTVIRMAASKECKIGVKKIAVASGVTWGLGVFFAGVFAAATGGFCLDFVNVMGSMYIGYAPTYAGAVIGGIWALIDGAVAGAIFGYIYNMV